MKLPPSSYYYKPTGKSLAQLKQEADLRDLIEAIVLEFPRYGYRRVTKALHRQGLRVNHKRVLRLMREHDLLCRPRRRWIRTTQSDHPYRVFPNLIRNLVTTSVDQVCFADITYIRILTAFVYLAVILVTCSRKTLGYAISSRVDTELTLRALRMALRDRNPPRGCSSITPTEGFNTLRMSMWICSGSMGFISACHRRGTPLTMPWWRASSRPLSLKRSIFGSTKPWQMSKTGSHTSSRKCIIGNGFILLWAILAQMSLKRCFQKFKTLSDPVRSL